MPRDFDQRRPHDQEVAPYPADRPGWCDAILADERPAPPASRSPGQALPEPEDLLGWSVLILTAPALVMGMLVLAGQTVLHLF
jgi:hypothetical protein